MGKISFQGSTAVTLDNKWRLAMPTRYRDVLAAVTGESLTLTKHPSGCISVFPRPLWDSFCERLEKLPMSADRWRRMYLGNAQNVEMDSAGRFLVAPELRAWAGITNMDDRKAMLLGLGGSFELWDAKKYDAHELETASSAMPESLQELTLG